MRFRLTIFGYEILSLELVRDEIEIVGIHGGETHNFERLPEYFDEEDFGFRNN